MDTRWKPCACVACQSHFEVGYPEQPEPVAWLEVPVPCPRCGRPKAVSVPRGAEHSLQVEAEDDVDEGGGG